MTENNSKKFIKRLSDEVGDFTVSLDLDVRLYEYDIRTVKFTQKCFRFKILLLQKKNQSLSKALIKYY